MYSKKTPVTPEGYKGLAGFHKYWGKKPLEAWSFLIQNLTREKEIIADPFLGSGLIAKECADSDRRFIGFDINPFSIELTKLWLDLPDYEELRKAVDTLRENIKPGIDSLYMTSAGDIITHILWEGNKIKKLWKKISRKRTELTLSEEEIISLENLARKAIPVKNDLNLFDNSRINARKDISLKDLFTYRALAATDKLMLSFDHYNGNIRRALVMALTASLGQMSNMVFAVTRRGKTKSAETEKIEVGSWVIGYWRPEQHFEINAWNCFENKADKLLRAVRDISNSNITKISDSFRKFHELRDTSYIKVGDAEALLQDIPDNTVKLILTDPPHGDRIPYLELSELWNTFLGFEADFHNELVVSDAKERKKTTDQYNKKLSSILIECARILKPQGFLAAIFNARSSDHWNSLHTLEAMSEADYMGCYPMPYSAGSVIQDNRKGSLTSDYVLLYGKQVTDAFRKKMNQRFSAVEGWSVEYPTGKQRSAELTV
ncbi:DNA methyltransferase [Desulfococcaceae bacterium HSG8]|nr:DNA methyltransferase [Desulfococcaceae bacterium HSG8]